MRTAIFVSVRNKARRLPGKTLHAIQGRSVIEHIIDRVRTAPGADVVVLTTSVHPDDRMLIEVARKNGIEAFAGSEDDKLDRYLDAAKTHNIDFAVVVDGDDVLCDPVAIGRIIAEKKANGGDFIVVDGLPLGVTGFGVDITALAKVVANKKEHDTEVWGQYFVENPAYVSKLLQPPPTWAHPEWRMTLDYPEDLAFFEQVFAQLYVPGAVFSFDAVVDLLTRKPNIVAINAGVQKAYAENLKKIIAEARCVAQS
jgi:spore coat polysaccharide biosynthesis protein SpsF (cytidylyltransferase family)